MRVVPIVIAVLVVVAIVGGGVAAIVYGATHDSLGLLVVGIALVVGMVGGLGLAILRARRL